MDSSFVKVSSPSNCYLSDLLTHLWKESTNDCQIFCKNGSLRVHLGLLVALCPTLRTLDSANNGAYSPDIDFNRNTITYMYSK